MSNNNKPGFAGKGYYIALILCAAAIGITGYWYYQSESNVRDIPVEETILQDIPADAAQVQDVPAIATQPATRPDTPSAPARTMPSVTPKKELKTMCPVEGAQITGYSMEALSYNQTTRDWRVHNGVDLAAEEGAPVVAAADGQVYTVYEDDYLGYTVVIRHDDGYTTRYSSLTEEIPVKSGEKVTMGQAIGCAGSTAVVETTLGSHVHFSVTKDNEPIDPAEFLAIGK